MAQAAFPGTAPLTPADNVDGGDDWREFTAAEMLSGLDLVALGGGRLARMIVLDEAGDLLAVNARGEARHLTNMPPGFVHVGKTRAIEPGQSAKITVYW